MKESDIHEKKGVREGRAARGKAAVNAGLAGAASDVVSRYGAGVKEHLVAYSGVDRETGRVLKRSLKGIAGSKVDPAHRHSNLKQQAGFSAEAKEVSRRRAEQAIAGRKPTAIRTDDLPGHVNDPLFDITAETDAAGNPVPGGSAQMKFVGSSPRAAVGKLLGPRCQKYIDSDCKMLVPSDYYDGMKADLRERMGELATQIEELKARGEVDAAARKQELLDKCRKLDRRLAKSRVSTQEAMEARTAPGASTAKDVLRVAHRAGVEQMKAGAAFGGGVSFIRNAVAVVQGEKSGQEAALAVAKDTAGAAAVSYAAGAGGAAIKGMMKNASSAYLRALSKSNLPAYVVTSLLETFKTVGRYLSGTIDGAECLQELGEKGYGLANSAMYATAGQVLIPIPVVGALAGTMLGYALGSMSYKALSESLKAAKLAREERIRVEAECEETVRLLGGYRQELEKLIREHLDAQQEMFGRTFSEIKLALAIDDVDGAIDGMNRITEAFGKKPLFRNKAELDALMASPEPLEF